MDVDLFDFDLPETAIALRPAEPRGSARMLQVAADGKLSDHRVYDLPGQLAHGDHLVINDTKVIPARLYGKRAAAGIEIMLHQQVGPVSWNVFARPAKKLRLGDRLNFGALTASVAAVGVRGERRLDFDIAPAEMMAALHTAGEMPLPPYIARRRAVDARDREDYQTVYATREGAVAAPTAGLHLTEEMLDTLAARGIGHSRVTLHVGAGTFLPVTAADTDDHQMHSETGEIRPEVAEKLNAVRAAGGRIVSVGTTTLRLLESAVDGQGRFHAFSQATDIFITPGYHFRGVDILMTNFHLPRSTLFMLVSAFSGLEVMLAAYRHAVTAGYRFYSYGDASLLFRAGQAHGS